MELNLLLKTMKDALTKDPDLEMEWYIDDFLDLSKEKLDAKIARGKLQMAFDLGLAVEEDTETGITLESICQERCLKDNNCQATWAISINEKNLCLVRLLENNNKDFGISATVIKSLRKYEKRGAFVCRDDVKAKDLLVEGDRDFCKTECVKSEWCKSFDYCKKGNYCHFRNISDEHF